MLALTTRLGLRRLIDFHFWISSRDTSFVIMAAKVGFNCAWFSHYHTNVIPQLFLWLRCHRLARVYSLAPRALHTSTPADSNFLLIALNCFCLSCQPITRYSDRNSDYTKHNIQINCDSKQFRFRSIAENRII